MERTTRQEGAAVFSSPEVSPPWPPIAREVSTAGRIRPATDTLPALMGCDYCPRHCWHGSAYSESLQRHDGFGK